MNESSVRAIDAHCHLADPRIEAELPRILKEAENAGISCFIQGGVDPEDWKRQAALKARFPGKILTSYGLHPWWIAARAPTHMPNYMSEEIETAFKELERMLSEADALGETGLDHSPRFEQTTHEPQKQAFIRQLRLREKNPSKPLVLHIVRAHEDALAILRAAEKEGTPLAGLVHSFSANREIARKYLDLGLHLSVSGAVTRKGFDTLRETVRYIPCDRLLLETDSPDQPPAGWEKKLNEPSTLLGNAELIANQRGEKADELLKRSAENVKKLFGVVQ